jgi:hypothetical protein
MALPIPANEPAMAIIVDADRPAALLLSIRERYQDRNSFMCLLDTIGLAVKERFRMLHDGYDDIETLVNHYANDISGFKKHLVRNNKTWMNHAMVRMASFFTPIMMDRLVGVLYYYQHSVKLLHTIPDPLLVTEDMADEYSTLYKESIVENEDNDEEIVIPTLTEAKHWSSFKESFLMSLNMTKGARGIPIDYVVDSTVRPYLRRNMNMGEEDTVDIDEQTLKTRTVHFGDGYKADNKNVWNKLKAALLDKPGYNHISQFNTARNGRSAWMSLLTYYEGAHYQQHLREVAFSKMQNTFYRGETARFTFEKFVNVHKQCHKMLQDAQYNNGLGMDNETKVQYFRNGIKVEAGIEVALSNARSQAQYQDFGALISMLSAEVDHHKTRKAALHNAKNRSASAAGRSNNSGGNRQGNRSGGGKLSGVKYENGVPYKVIDGKRIEGRFYDQSDFRKFTPKQREACLKMKSFKKGGKSSGGGGDSNTSNHAVESVSRDEVREDMITLADAMVAGVRAASLDNESDTVASSNNNTSITGGSRASGDSGSVGDIFRNRNKRRKRN